MIMKKNSIWLNNNDIKCLKLEQDTEVDVLIVGGGITGLSCLLELKNTNLKTILVERNICGHGVTNRSTAKITYLQEQIYLNIRKSSYDKANQYLKSQIEAASRLKDIITKNQIDCDLKEVSSYIFTIISCSSFIKPRI